MEDVTRGIGEMMGMAQNDPTKVLTEEHNKVKDLFGEFERATDMDKRRKVFADIAKNLNVHAGVEEAVFYPAVQQIVGMQMIEESLKEHMQMKEHISHTSLLMGREIISQEMPEMGQGRTVSGQGMSGQPMDTELRTSREESARQVSSTGYWVSDEQAMGEYQPRSDTEMQGTQAGMGTESTVRGQSSIGRGQQMGISGTYMDHYRMLKETVTTHVQKEEGQMFPQVKQAIPEDQLGKIARMMFETKQQLS